LLIFPSPTAEEPRYERVHRVLRRYDEHLTAEEREFLKLFSVFRLPVQESAFEKVFEPLLKLLNKKEMQRLVSRLANYRLIRHDEHEKSYTTHLLIRNHYFALFSKGDPLQEKATHKQIKDYYLSIAGDVVPQHPMLDDIKPLLEAIYHTCRSGDFDSAYKLYTEIEAPPPLYPPAGRSILMFELGAYDTCVELLSNFFQDPDFSSEPNVNDLVAKSYLITDLGIALGQLGRLNDAELLYQRALDIDLRRQSLGSVSCDYHDLAEVCLDLGTINTARINAQFAVDFAKQANDAEEEWTSLSYQARSAFLAGDIQSSEEYFRLSIDIHRRLYPELKSLHDLWGVWYAGYLIRTDRFQEAYDAANENLKYSEIENQAEVVSQCFYVLGHCLVVWGRHDDAVQYYNESLAVAQRTSSLPILIEGLLARGLFFGRYYGDAATALSDLRDALGYAVKSRFRIYEADTRIALAWAHLAIGEKEKAKQSAERALQMSNEMGYHWGKVDAEEVLKAISG